MTWERNPVSSGHDFGFAIDNDGAGRPLAWDRVRDWNPEDGFLWLHLDYTSHRAREWLIDGSGLDDVTREALLAQDPRPRSVQVGDGLMAIIRGVNLNEGSDPEDMVALRVWVDRSHLITLRRYVAPQRDLLSRLQNEKMRRGRPCRQPSRLNSPGPVALRDSTDRCPSRESESSSPAAP